MQGHSQRVARHLWDCRTKRVSVVPQAENKQCY